MWVSAIRSRSSSVMDGGSFTTALLAFDVLTLSSCSALADTSYLTSPSSMSPQSYIHVFNISAVNEKDIDKIEDVESFGDSESNFGILHDEREIATHVISVADDPSLNPWTLRSFIIGIGLSAFGGVLGKSAT